uniref:Acyltransferase 3 domain-containing protein n=1 Tax=Parascaris univalens TaxID=6257 RepID=A0A915A9M1_PARUN
VIAVLLFGCVSSHVLSYSYYKPAKELAALPFNTSVVENQQCQDDANFWVASLNTFTSWVGMNCHETDRQCNDLKAKMITDNLFAAKQIDSFGRLPSGLLELNTIWQGSWEECMGVNTPQNSDYRTHYCWVAVAPNFLAEGTNVSVCSAGMSFRWSVCMPETCNNQDVKKLIQTMGGGVQTTLSFCRVNCRPRSGPEKSGAFWFVTAYCLLVALLMVISTTIDYVISNDSEAFKPFRASPGIRALLTFSVYTNGAEILSVEKRPGQIDCLHCIRAFSLAWVIFGHVTTLFLYGDNSTALLASTKEVQNDIVFNAFFAVDSFLFISGVLLAYIFYKEMDRNPRKMKNPIYWILFYVHRILRISPPYFFFIGFYTVMYPYFTNGPTELTAGASEVEYCKKYWWRNILYINNFFPLDEMCMGHSWYLSTDMQVHIFSPLLLVPLFYSKIAGAISVAFFFILSIASCYGVHFKYDFPATLFIYMIYGKDQSGIDDYMMFLYAAPWVRCTPYIMGILTGYFLHKTKGKKLTIHPLVAIILWCASVAIALACVLGLYNNIKGIPISIATAASYNNFSRVGWALALAWVVIACQNNVADANIQERKQNRKSSSWRALLPLTLVELKTQSGEATRPETQEQIRQSVVTLYEEQQNENACVRVHVINCGVGSAFIFGRSMPHPTSFFHTWNC